MASAACNNCDRGEWTLRKHPDDYSGNGPSCPDCGSTRVDVFFEGGRESRGGRQERREEPRERRPARREEPARGEERRPARRETGGQGAGMDDVIALFDDDVDTRRRAESAKNVLGGLGGIAEKLMNYQEQKKQAKEARAEQVELEQSNLPACDDCGYQFDGDDIGLNTSTVRCPECAAVYEIRE